jgi:tRNA1Val (adenine37-N6)-methyltransferase
MKVCTDACILGAWASSFPVIANTSFRILDIGTGTGLLSLMLAQAFDATIDAVEIDPSAYQQALINTNESQFANKISVHHRAIQDFDSPHSYQLIVSNPPFYQNNLQSPNHQRNKALHAETLHFDDLIDSVCKYLSTNGTFFVLLPAYEMTVFTDKAISKGLFPNKSLVVRHHEGSKIFRVVKAFTKIPTTTEAITSFNIYDQSQQYSLDFVALLRDYYIIF